MNITQLLLAKTTFTGSFYFTRFVSNPEITITGSAVFLTTTNKAVSYQENGVYRLNDEEHTCYQKQTFLFTEDSLIIHNNNMETLHHFNLKSIDAAFKDTHTCQLDRYTIDIDIQSNDQFTIFYRIQGPKKNYSIKTFYTRQENDNL